MDVTSGEYGVVAAIIAAIASTVVAVIKKKNNNGEGGIVGKYEAKIQYLERENEYLKKNLEECHEERLKLQNIILKLRNGH